MKLGDVAYLQRDSYGVPTLKDAPVLSHTHGTALSSELFDAFIQELYHAILGFGLTPSSDNTQLYQIIKSIKDSSTQNHSNVTNDITRITSDFNQKLSDAVTQGEKDLAQQAQDANNQMQDVYNQLVARCQDSATALQAFMQEMVGKPLPCSSDVVPDNCLPCDGSTFSTTQYPMLAKIYPSGVLPDLRGKFIRGTNTDTSQINPDNTAVLGYQDDAVYAGVDFRNSVLGYLTTNHARAQWHKHDGLSPDPTPAPTPAFEVAGQDNDAKFADLGAWNSWDHQSRWSIWVALNFLSNQKFRYATETRPVSTTMQWVVYVGNNFDLVIPELFS